MLIFVCANVFVYISGRTSDIDSNVAVLFLVLFYFVYRNIFIADYRTGRIYGHVTILPEKVSLKLDSYLPSVESSCWTFVKCAIRFWSVILNENENLYYDSMLTTADEGKCRVHT